MRSDFVKRLTVRCLLIALVAPLVVGIVAAPTAQADFNTFNNRFSSNTILSFGMSANGRYQLMVDNATIYLSSDFGASFSNIRTVGGTAAVAVSSDGSKMVIGAESAVVNSYATPGSLYVSTDFGATWTEKTGSATKAWSQIQISDDGTKMIGITEATQTTNRGLFYSTNSGTSWTEYVVSNAYWETVKISSNGSVMWASNSNSTAPGLYSSVNAGSSWSRKTTTVYVSTSCGLAINSTGTTIYVANSNNLYKSTDTGTTFAIANILPAPDPYGGQSKYPLQCISASSNGQKLLIGGTNDFAQVSADTGTTWTRTELDPFWGQSHYIIESAGIAISGDGTLTMVNALGALYEYQFALPSVIQNFAVTVPANTTLNLSWSAPSSSGDAAISNYQVETSTNGTVWNLIKRSDTTTASLSQTGLTQGTTYYYRITGANKWGLGASYTSRAYVPGPIPRAQSAIVTTPGDSQVGLSWTSPTETSPVRTFVVEYSSNGGSTYTAFAHADSTSPSITVTGLTNGTSYLFRISATNDAGTGPTIVSSAAVPKTLPDAPTSVAGTSTTTVINLSWSAPANNGGSAITDYVIRYSSDGGSTWTTYTDSVTAVETATVSGLTNGVTYYFRVAAKNVVGTGNESANSSAIMLLDVGPATITLSLPGGVKVANKSTVVLITATTSQDGVVVFYLGSKRIPGCVSKVTISKVVTCSWKPPVRGSASLRATLKPTNTYYSMVSSPTLNTTISSRVGTR